MYVNDVCMYVCHVCMYVCMYVCMTLLYSTRIHCTHTAVLVHHVTSALMILVVY
jgi:hypothetical protein